MNNNNSRVVVEIDIREKKSFDPSNISNSNSNHEYSFSTLPLGDFKLTLEGDDSKCLIIERKSVQDLAASIIDGRFKEQKNRLMRFVESGGMIAYIIEGCRSILELHNVTNSRMNPNALSTCITNTSVRDRIPVIFSLDCSETSHVINLIAEKLPKIFEHHVKGTCAPNAIIGKSTVKNELLKDEMSAAMLCQIPGISFSVARAIISNAPSPSPSIFFPWMIGNNNVENIIERLRNIKVSDKQKLGPKRAENIAKSITQ